LGRRYPSYYESINDVEIGKDLDHDRDANEISQVHQERFALQRGDLKLIAETAVLVLMAILNDCADTCVWEQG